MAAVARGIDISNRAARRWTLAGIEADAFCDTPQVREQWPFGRHICLRLAMWILLQVFEHRVSDDASAVCLLTITSPRGWRRALVRSIVLAVVVSVGAALAVLAWAPLFWLVSVAMLAVLAPCARSSWRNRHGASALRALAPIVPSVHIHGVARRPGPGFQGSGARLIGEITAEADVKDWRLTLDAGSPRLVSYYQTFGFTALGAPVDMTWGQAVRMAREPTNA